MVNREGSLHSNVCHETIEETRRCLIKTAEEVERTEGSHSVRGRKRESGQAFQGRLHRVSVTKF